MRENGYRAFWQFAADYVHHFCFTKNSYLQGRRSAISSGGPALETDSRRRHVFVGVGGWGESSPTQL